MTDERVLGLIPARGGSKGVPRKNIRPLDGRPLIGYTIEAANRSEAVTSTVVSTEDNEIAEVAEDENGRVPFQRPVELAEDTTPSEPVIEHAIAALSERGEQYEELVLLQPTSPLRTAVHIDDAYRLFETAGCDSLISVCPTHEIRWERGRDGARRLDDPESASRRQDRETKYVSNGAIYITKIENFRRTSSLTSGTTELYEMDEPPSVDIDTPFDFWLAERIIEDWYDGHD